MPTGYTYPVVDGRVTSFQEFAISCARAFGACIEMRDDPMDAPIPEEFKPSDYHANALKTAKDKLLSLRAMTDAGIKKEASADFKRRLEAHTNYQAEQETQNTRLNKMLDEVKAWKPPTKDHQGMKDFMIEQLTMSLHDPKFSSPAPVEESPEKWFAIQVAGAERDIKYHAEHQQDDIRRAAERTQWVKDLRASLVPSSVAEYERG